VTIDPIIAGSARKHGVTDDDMLHAYANPVRLFAVDEGLQMLIGPDRAARLLEIGVVEGDLAPVIVHAMAARQKFLR
jgi:hypothetical protein